MNLTDISSMVAGLKIPWCYDHFDVEPAPPYIVYYYPAENDFMADGENYANIRQVVFELYTKQKDFTLESTVETALKTAGLTWYKTTDYIDGEKIYQTTYETEVIING